jgi:hypothetical protein
MSNRENSTGYLLGVWEYPVVSIMLVRRGLVELPQGYKLEEMGQNLLLKRPNGYVLATFRQGIKPENIQRVAKADQKYLRAVEREERFSLGADSETVLMFSEDVKEARTEFLLALEVAYRGKDA